MCTRDGDYFIDVKLGLIDIIQSPFVLTVDPADTEPRMCTCTGIDNAAGNGLKGGQAGQNLIFRIQAVDKFGNRVNTPGDDFQVSITETIEQIRVRAKVIDNGDGTYEVTWVGMIRGEYKISVHLMEEEILGEFLSFNHFSRPRLSWENLVEGGVIRRFTFVHNEMVAMVHICWNCKFCDGSFSDGCGGSDKICRPDAGSRQKLEKKFKAKPNEFSKCRVTLERDDHDGESCAPKVYCRRDWSRRRLRGRGQFDSD